MMELPSELGNDLTQIVLYLEQGMTEMIEKANEKIEGINDYTLNEINEANILRDKVWEDYYQMKRDRICSRCGNYSKYEIIETIQPTAKELNDRYGHNFHQKIYTLKSTTITNKNSLDSDWGNICKACRNHILGIKPFPLSSSRAKAERELVELKKIERTRLLFQEDEIKEARTKLNKSRREGIEPKAKHQSNPNDIYK